MASTISESQSNSMSSYFVPAVCPPDLPIEVIIHIMEYLRLSDRICAGQVCRVWMEASKDLQFLDKESTYLHDDLFRPLQVFENSDIGYRILHLIFKEVELSGNRVDGFLDRFCPTLRSLTIQNCDISGKTFVDILKRCAKLESLSLIGCRELLISGRLLDNPSDIQMLRNTLVNLRELILDLNRYLSDSLFSRFVSIAPNLQVLSLAGCQISFHPGLYKKFYPENLSASAAALPSESVLTFHFILQYLVLQSHKIRQIRFGNTLLDNDALCKIAELPQLCLDTLEVHSCNQLSHNGILAITERQKMITKLDFSKCLRIVDQSLLSICSSMTNLTSLNLRRCRALTNRSVAELCQLKKLTDIDLSFCEFVNSDGIVAGLCSFVNKNLSRLNLTALTLDENTVCRLSESLPNLVHLDLGWCCDAVTDKAIQAVCRNLIWLRTLKLVSCDKLTDAGFTGMGMSGPTNSFGEETSREMKYNFSTDTVEATNNFMSNNSLKHNISLRSKAEQDIVNDAKRKQMVSEMCEDQYLKLTGSGISLLSLKGLQDLDLMGCNRITDVSLKYAFNFRELRHINLGRCQQITYQGLAQFTANNPGIETLYMSQCYNVTDAVIVNISQTLVRLKFLDLQSCNQLTDNSLRAIGKSCKNLHFLDVSQCMLMSLEEAENLEQLIPSLHTIIHIGLSLKLAPPEPPEPPLKPPPKPPKKGLRYLLHRR